MCILTLYFHCYLLKKIRHCMLEDFGSNPNQYYSFRVIATQLCYKRKKNFLTLRRPLIPPPQL